MIKCLFSLLLILPSLGFAKYGFEEHAFNLRYIGLDPDMRATIDIDGHKYLIWSIAHHEKCPCRTNEGIEEAGMIVEMYGHYYLITELKHDFQCGFKG